MIITVSLNPSIDKTMTIQEFVYGGMNRIIDTRIDAAGKGINVTIAYNQLGGQVLCTGINYEEGGNLITDKLDKAGIGHDFILVDGQVRTNNKIYDRSKQVVTELNDRGYPVDKGSIIALRNKIKTLCMEGAILVLSGSVPEGVPDSIYRDILEDISKLPVHTILDAEGTLLSKGIEARPNIIKPNLFELEGVLGKRIESGDDAVKGARLLIDRGIEVVGVSLGAEGAIIVDENETFFAPALDIDVKGTTGAGDSMVAGFCLAVEEGLSLENMLRYGMAAATASIAREGTLLCTREGFESMLEMVEVEKIL